MDLIAWIESHLALIVVTVSGLSFAGGRWLAADRRGGDLATGLASLDVKLDRHAESLATHAREDASRTEAGFTGVNHRLDTLNSKVFDHERDIGELHGRIGKP